MKPRSSFLKTFFRIFPPPAYLNMPYGGIDIADDAVRYLEFKKTSHKSLEIGRYASEALPPGVVEGGYIKNEEALTAAIVILVKKLGINRVKASLPEEKVYLFRTPVPSLDSKEISQNIESKIEENVPLSAADAIFSYSLILGGVVSASVSVVPTKVVETYLRVLKNAGLTVFGFDTPAKAFARAAVTNGSEETVLLIYGMNGLSLNKKVGIYVVYRGVVSFTLTLSIESDPVQDILKGIQGVLGYWLDHGENYQTDPKVDSKKLINRIVVCAPTTIAEAVDYAGAQLKIPVTTASVWTNAFSTEKHTPAITAADSLAYALAVGLALPEWHI